jgi:putative oxidoreductase
MSADAGRTIALAPPNPIARLTSAVFGLIPAWLPLLVLRLTLARPFFASGLTRWDGWFTLSFGTKILFAQEYKLHIFGAEIPFPMPELVAAMASTAEIVLPILVAFGLLTRWAALGLLCMTAVIQLTYPDAWRDYHLPWAAMALAIMTFGPGAISIDRLIGLDGWGKARKAE